MTGNGVMLHCKTYLLFRFDRRGSFVSVFRVFSQSHLLSAVTVFRPGFSLAPSVAHTRATSLPEGGVAGRFDDMVPTKM